MIDIRQGEHPCLIAEARTGMSLWCILIDGQLRLTREIGNGDLAAGSFEYFVKLHPGRVLLVFSQGNRDGDTIFETVVARG